MKKIQIVGHVSVHLPELDVRGVRTIWKFPLVIVWGSMMLKL